MVILMVIDGDNGFPEDDLVYFPNGRSITWGID